jgi:hypothetical protein
VEAKIIGNGRQDYLWSPVIINILLQAIVCLLARSVTSKPVIQALDNEEGFNAYLSTSDVTVSLQTRPKLQQFSIFVHSLNDFSPESISLLSVGYLNATNVKHEIDEIDEPPTKRLYVKVDSSAQWRLMEKSAFEEDDAIIFTPDKS